MVCLSCEAIILKLENAATFFFLQNHYNMHKTLFRGGYLICNIKVTIFVGCTMIADKKRSVQRNETLEALEDNIFRRYFSYFLSFKYLHFSLHIFFSASHCNSHFNHFRSFLSLHVTKLKITVILCLFVCLQNPIERKSILKRCKLFSNHSLRLGIS